MNEVWGVRGWRLELELEAERTERWEGGMRGWRPSEPSDESGVWEVGGWANRAMRQSGWGVRGLNLSSQPCIISLQAFSPVRSLTYWYVYLCTIDSLGIVYIRSTIVYSCMHDTITVDWCNTGIILFSILPVLYYIVQLDLRIHFDLVSLFIFFPPLPKLSTKGVWCVLVGVTPSNGRACMMILVYLFVIILVLV
jgi:hypothetical protein